MKQGAWLQGRTLEIHIKPSEYEFYCCFWWFYWSAASPWLQSCCFENKSLSFLLHHLSRVWQGRHGLGERSRLGSGVRGYATVSVSALRDPEVRDIPVVLALCAVRVTLGLVCRTVGTRWDNAGTLLSLRTIYSKSCTVWTKYFKSKA